MQYTPGKGRLLFNWAVSVFWVLRLGTIVQPLTIGPCDYLKHRFLELLRQNHVFIMKRVVTPDLLEGYGRMRSGKNPVNSPPGSEIAWIPCEWSREFCDRRRKSYPLCGELEHPTMFVSYPPRLGGYGGVVTEMGVRTSCGEFKSAVRVLL